MSAAPADSIADLSHKAKVWLALAFLASTVSTALVGAGINHHFVVVQADDASKKADVRKLEDQVSAFDQLVRVYMMGLNKGEASEAQREAILANAQSQYDFLGTLTPLLDPDARKGVEAYRNRLIEVSSALRKSEDIVSTRAFGQSVSYAIDERAVALSALRRAVGMPEAGSKA
ncbi:hypothetical protein [Sphingomonas glacialis]|uniref:Methyl-accepting chemotaxis protein n=1 Tax=Sphingomonas glacialis TaxID=658225 RepID=A0A502G638_9SPHN|nr:hypothetical protein [Sphingomonas glacialis]TPG56343.1 hypothetical protein EAH76_01920 [Sphingomonas glacialis]